MTAPFDAVVTHHRDGFRSGVARFNELLAGELGIPLLGIPDLVGGGAGRPLLSFKVRELSERDADAVQVLLDRAGTWSVFLHEFNDLPLERALVAGAMRVYCGNRRIADALALRGVAVDPVWTPGLIRELRSAPSADVVVFSFGMAHKLQLGRFEHLRRLLDASGRSYVVRVSAANHETASLRDADAVFSQLERIFGDSLYFLGNLSDRAVHDELQRATFFAAFFPGGVRDNNTSVASAMERGCVVLTNLDEFSPGAFRHLETVVDIDGCESLPLDPTLLETIGRNAEAAAATRDWQALVRRLVD